MFLLLGDGGTLADCLMLLTYVNPNEDEDWVSSHPRAGGCSIEIEGPLKMHGLARMSSTATSVMWRM